jgi:cytoskeletal protein CcmA (bactofilin family)
MLFRRAKPELNDNEPSPLQGPEQATVIGRDAEFAGDLCTSGDVRIEGVVRGTVKARCCVVDIDGAVEGQIVAEEIVIRGRVQGPLKGYFVHLADGAQVQGDIVNERIVIDSGAELTGSVWRDADPLGPEQAFPARATQAMSDDSRFPPTSLWPETEARDNRPLTAARLR